MRRTASVLVLVVGIAFSARVAEASFISLPTFTDPCSSSGSSSCTPSTDSIIPLGTLDELVPTTTLPSTFDPTTLTQLPGLTVNGLPIDLSLTISLDGGCDPTHPCTPTVVPEPGSILLLGTGLTALAARLRNRRRRHDA